MKVIISQEQNEMFMKIIKELVDSYKRYPVLKTEGRVEYDDMFNYYLIYPTFYLDKEIIPIISDRSLKIHLEDYISNFFGVDAVVGSPTILPFK